MMGTHLQLHREVIIEDPNQYAMERFGSAVSMYPSCPPYLEKLIELQVVPGTKISQARRKYRRWRRYTCSYIGINYCCYCHYYYYCYSYLLLLLLLLLLLFIIVIIYSYQLNCKCISIISCITVSSEILGTLRYHDGTSQDGCRK